MTLKTRRVDKNMVKYDLAIGKHPGEIAKEWGVSRQYISSIRQELVKEGVLQRGKPGRPARTASNQRETALDLSDIKQMMNKIQAMMFKMKLLEEERNQYKKAYAYLIELLSKYLDEQSMQSVIASSKPNVGLIERHIVAKDFREMFENRTKNSYDKMVNDRRGKK